MTPKKLALETVNAIKLRAVPPKEVIGSAADVSRWLETVMREEIEKAIQKALTIPLDIPTPMK